MGKAINPPMILFMSEIHGAPMDLAHRWSAPGAEETYEFGHVYHTHFENL